MTLRLEEFTAVAMCPHCQSVAVHPFRAATVRESDNAPLAQAMRQLNDSMSMAWLWGSVPPRVHVAPDGAAVIRECACGAEWAQR